jgi:transposase
VIFVGDDWAEAHHDLYVMDQAGTRLASRRLPEGIEGMAALHQLVASLETDPGEVVVGIETDRGLWVEALVASGYVVYAINPMALARYRDRHHVGGGKSDPGDAKVLADVVRTDRHNHRPLAGDSPEAEAVQLLARAHQNLIWARTRHSNQLRSGLRQYYPAALAAFPELDGGDALAVLGKAPTPSTGAALTVAQIRELLQRGGRQRNLQRRAEEIKEALATETLPAAPAVSEAFSQITKATVGVISELNHQIAQLEAALGERFRQHPDAAIILSLPGLGDTLGARVLGEFGDAPDRYADAKSRRNYAGTSPLTIASGKKRAVVSRHVRNRRLYDAIHRWAFCSLTASPGCRAFYDQRRALGDYHHQALRALGNHLVGFLHGCLRHQTAYREEIAWGQHQPRNQTAA